MGEIVTCPLCGLNAELSPKINDGYGISCALCGDYILTDYSKSILKSLPEFDRRLLSQSLRVISEETEQTLTLDDLTIFKIMAGDAQEQ